MRVRLQFLSALALLPMIAGCAIKPPPPLACGFRFSTLEVEAPVSDTAALAGATSQAAPPGTFAAELDASFGPSRLGAIDADPGSVLVLSGGSQHGAFGAGFLDEWRRQAGSLPRFRLVTGISTGAILATFAFVGNTDPAVRGYTITKEAEILAPLVSWRGQKPTTGGYISLLRKGALADLRPLEARLDAFIGDAVLLEVAQASDAGARKLVVGVVDVAAGKTVLLDLADMARRFAAATQAQDEAGRTTAKRCYYEAILASSSAPMAALPVFIDNRMYVDGGIRFGMFAAEIGQWIDRRAAAARSSSSQQPPAPAIHMIVNGTLDIGSRCYRRDPVDCVQGADPVDNVKTLHADWNFLDLLLRTKDNLENQVYRFSADRVQSQARAAGVPLRFARIETSLETQMHTEPAPDGRTMNCQDWRTADRAELDPIQFYPRYMRCVIAHGRAEARAKLAGDWATRP